jgi:hypothetical protein
MVYESMIESALPTVQWIARVMERKGQPYGVNRDDLESVGNEALMEARAYFDPDKYTWIEFVKLTARSRMTDEINKAKQRRSRTAPLEIETADGEFLPREDTRADRPDDRAAAREGMAKGKPATLAVTQVRAGLPTPDAVALKVAALREAMFSAVKTEDVTEVMGSLVEKAKAGDLKAMKLFLDYLAPSRSGVVVQQAVVVNPGDAC